MRKISVYIATSIDGYIARRDHALDWLERVGGFDEDYGFKEFIQSVDTVILGRKTYEIASTVADWPYKGKKLLVLSRTLTNVREGAEVTTLEKLALPQNHIWVDGGSTLSQFLNLGLVDEIIISTIPIILGSGISLFQNLLSEKSCQLLSCKSYKSGLVQTHYKVLRFSFRHVDASYRYLIHEWLKEPHVAEWFYGQGLENTINHLDDFLKGEAKAQYWLGFDGTKPIAFFITSNVEKPHDEWTHWSLTDGKTITLDMLIGDKDYLGKGLATQLIEEFLSTHFASVKEVLIDPEASNKKAVHVYQKAGFTIIAEFIPSHSPNLHYMMRKSC